MNISFDTQLKTALMHKKIVGPLRLPRNILCLKSND